MRKQIINLFSICLGVAMVAGACYAIFRLVAFLIVTLRALDPTVAASLVAGSITIIGSVVAVTLGRYFEKAKEVESAFRERRLKTYEGFISTFMDLSSGKDEGPDLVSFLRQMNKEMILWAGPKLLRAYILFFKQAIVNPKAGRSFFILEDFYKAIRQDLGHSNAGLKRGDILTLVLKFDELGPLLENMKKDPNYTLATTPEVKK